MIKQWEEAGASLVVAFKDYMDMCLRLGNNFLYGEAQKNNLVRRIDSTLELVHTRISHYLEECGRALVTNRNRLASPLCNLPEEILSEIFLNVVFDRDDSEGSQEASMRQDVWLIYRRLYRLIGVCSNWRDVLTERGLFWSVIPMVSTSLTNRQGPFELSLHRAAGSELHLAVDRPVATSSDTLLTVLANHGHHIRAISMCVNGDSKIIRDVAGQLLEHAPYGSLSELSIRFTDSESSHSDYIFPRDSPQQASFSRLIQSLTNFRIFGTRFYWDTLSFSSQLVELKIERVGIGYDERIAPFIHALSSATGLRDLEIMATSTVRKRETISNPTPLSPITFPALQSLSIEDLYLNTLERLPPMIAPGSHLLTLFLSPDSLQINVRRGERAEDTTGITRSTDFWEIPRSTRS